MTGADHQPSDAHQIGVDGRTRSFADVWVGEQLDEEAIL